MFKAFDAMSDSLSLVPLQKKFSDVIHKPAHWTVSWVSWVHTQTHTHPLFKQGRLQSKTIEMVFKWISYPLDELVS